MTSLPGLCSEATCRSAVECCRRWQTTDDDRRQRRYDPYTMCRWASRHEINLTCCNQEDEKIAAFVVKIYMKTYIRGSYTVTVNCSVWSVCGLCM